MLSSVFIYLLIGLCTLLYIFVKKRFSYWKDRGVPYLEPSFPYGNLKGVTKTIHFKEIVLKLYKEFKNKSPICGLYMLIEPVVLVTDLDLAKNILIKDFNNFTDRPFYYNEKDDPLSAHLFSIGGQKWKVLRTKLSPTFTSGKMKFMYSTVANVAKELNEAIAKVINEKDEIEIRDILARYTTDVIGTCAFGIECNSLKDPNAEFRIYGQKAFSEPRSTGFILLFKSKFHKLSRLLGLKHTRDDVSKFFLDAVQETVKLREKNNIRRNDFMDLLIELKNGVNNPLGKLTVEEIAAQAFLFFLAGFETSSTNMSYALYELSQHQDIQDKLRNEILTVLKKHNNELTYEALMEMSYLDQVMIETLRKYPALAALSRVAIDDYQVPDTNFVIEKGLEVLIPTYGIHHDPEIYPDPEKFDPDRFHPDEINNRHSLSFLGFGDGPRNCIGLRFGKMQTKIGLASLLINYSFSISPKTQIPLKFSAPSFVIAPEGGLWLKVKKI